MGREVIDHEPLLLIELVVGPRDDHCVTCCNSGTSLDAFFQSLIQCPECIAMGHGDAINELVRLQSLLSG